MKHLFPLWTVVLSLASAVAVPVGEYLYASLEKLPEAAGTLTVQFETPQNDGCILLAWGHRHRKGSRKQRETTEAQRELFKPRIAQFSPDRKSATFAKMQPDFYDLALIDPKEMLLTEGIALLPDEEELSDGETLRNSVETVLLQRREDGRISVWESFFDEKRISRIEGTPGGPAAVLLQQQRTATALEESGAKVKEFIHSIDVVWLSPAAQPDKPWQVVQRQQLFRKELPSTDFFRAAHSRRLSSIRVGTKPKLLRFPSDDETPVPNQ